MSYCTITSTILLIETRGFPGSSGHFNSAIESAYVASHYEHGNGDISYEPSSVVKRNRIFRSFLE